MKKQTFKVGSPYEKYLSEIYDKKINGKLKFMNKKLMIPCIMRNDNLIEIKEKSTTDEIREMIKKADEEREPYYKKEPRTDLCKI